MSSRKLTFLPIVVAGILAIAPSLVRAEILKNDKINAEFNAQGIVSIHDAQIGRTIQFKGDESSITVDGKTLGTAGVNPVSVDKSTDSLTYNYKIDGQNLKVIYEVKPGWRFVSKQLVYAREPGAAFRVDKLEMYKGSLITPIAGEHKINGGTWGTFLRFGRDDSPTTDAGYGMLVVIQNRFIDWSGDKQSISTGYSPDMEWKSAYGDFESDRVLFAPYRASGTKYPARSVAEWSYQQFPNSVGADTPKVDFAEVDTFAQCVRAFLLFTPEKSIRMDVGWCVNDYQIDVSTPDGIAQYKRIIDRSAEVGCNAILYGPKNNDVSSESESRDAWGWENVLWLGMGQKIRKGEWDPAKDPIPASVQSMINYANGRGVKLVAYAYPTLGWMQDPEWTKWIGREPGGYSGADTGIRSFQDWFVKKLVDFQKKTGCGGYSFDHWWIDYGKPATSKYAQWYGCRRIIMELRKACPDIIIDGRQQYHWFGPWTVLGGSYPHPFGGDEQPGSFTATADLHTDRVYGNRQRAVTWNYRMQSFMPIEVTPGFTTHQTQRSDEKGTMHRDTWRTRDWDLLGWKYSVISSIATGPMNNVWNYVPARDVDEFNAFSEADKKWARKWMDFTDKNFAYMRNMRPIIGAPLMGRCDGSAAIIEDKGFVFLFNPNYRKMDATFALDQSIGLTKGSKFVLKQLYPAEGTLLGKPGAGLWTMGDSVAVPMEGCSAMVFEVMPAPQQTEPLVFNLPGKAKLSNGILTLTGVKGEVGSKASMMVLAPTTKKVRALTINGKKVGFAQSGNIIDVKPSFAGSRFSQCQQIGKYDPNFAGGTFKGEFTVPSRVFAQLKARKKAWPVPYTEDDLKATWIGSHRLLLFIDIIKDDSSREGRKAFTNLDIRLTVDGKPVEVKKSYNGIYPNSGDQTFIGYYADLSWVKPDTKHKIEVTLPELKPGQFQGLFFDNVETQYTGDLLGGPLKPFRR